jgi:Flp pilus assembly pilin Flp
MLDIATFKSLVKGAVADRKGATALEYALIAAAVVTIVIAAFRLMFGRLSTYLGTINFS